ncbi:hypothetical protein BKA56DRAFT_575881 [Ilyonectria sp. MPI-CAGE-AT-0026]|nr:hypothetical protein BKA56DRAFT_575881 [Ilyonectria sp. MPI-CAGE-AT-0026]
MMPVECIVCGAGINKARSSPEWMGRFRAIYTADSGWDAARLSGEGEITGTDTYTIPYDVSMGSGPGINPEVPTIALDVNRTSFSPLDPQAPPEPIWGYMFHYSCWDLLSTNCASEGVELNVQALFDICRSLPIIFGIMDWDHDYGGVFIRGFKQSKCFPSGSKGFVRPPVSHICDQKRYDPMRVTGLRNLFTPSPRHHISSSGIKYRTLDDLKPEDPFNSLPLEVLSKVVVMLSSREVLNLKLASPVFATMILPESFWRSRFLPGREFSHIYESSMNTSVAGSWRSLYDRTRSFDNSMINRKRVWALASSITKLLNQRLGSMICHGNPVKEFLRFQIKYPYGLWATAISDVHEFNEHFFHGSRELWKRRVSIPRSFQAIHASYVNIEHKKYISGLQFTQQSGEVIKLGYLHPQRMVGIAGHDIEDGIVGFQFAIDDRGIRGVAAYAPSFELTNWVGDYLGVPKRNLLISTYPQCPPLDPRVTVLEAGFDALKLVSLSLTSNIEASDSDASDSDASDSETYEIEIPDEIPGNETPDTEAPSTDIFDNQSNHSEAHEELDNDGSAGGTTTSAESDVDSTDSDVSYVNPFREPQPPPEPDSLRDSQLWYPEIPGPNLDFVGLVDFRITYRQESEPYTVALFGGQNGQHLPLVSEVVVCTIPAPPLLQNFHSFIWSIEFIYNEPIDGERSLLIGRDSHYPVRGKQQFSARLSSHEGERINHIEAFYQHSGVLCGFEINTNRGQTAMFPFSFDHDPIFSEVLEPGPNTIVGIYGVYNSEFCLSNLGLLTTDVSS